MLTLSFFYHYIYVLLFDHFLYEGTDGPIVITLAAFITTLLFIFV